MPIVWGIVKDHDGHLDLESTVGQGTTFRIYFPVTNKRPDLPPMECQEDLRGNGEKILIIDDDENQRNIAGMMLTHLGYTTQAACCGEEGVALIGKNHRFDLVILDMIMPPGMDGFETYKQIVSICEGQKAIIASGYSETERVKKTIALGAGAYLKKPYTLNKLALLVKKELAKC
jgi:DNA-binding NtrC family response regulator